MAADDRLKPETDTMGRPLLQVRKTTIPLPVAVFDRIAALVGDRRMAEFIRDAVLAELERREAAGSKPDPEKHPKLNI